MKLTIHNVGHGSCISFVHGDKAVLWDCGSDDYRRPSVFLRQMGVKTLEALFITNYDEDHISDMVDLCQALPPRSLWRNRTITAGGLRQLKETRGDITPAMRGMLAQIHPYPNLLATVPFLDALNVKTSFFCNSFADFEDTNNCSLVTFLSYNGISFIFPGDLERAGWKKLLEDSSFRDELAGVRYFVASHHGRESGYCKEVFDYCKPHAVIFSDSNIKYATQEMAAAYGQHCSGVSFNGENRHVLSTRKDNDIFCLLDSQA